jgi:myxalamid-type polyketide synthase MxaB
LSILENFETHFEGLKEIKKTVFVFSGHGTEWVGMGQKLVETEAVFKETLAKCAEAHEKAAGWNILEEIMKPESKSRMDDSEVAHPCLVAMEIALVELLKSRGVTPDAVVGHSVGEVAAAYCAGYLDIENSFKAVWYQTEVMNLVRGKGRMLFIGQPESELQELLDEHKGELSVAAVNSHDGAVLSGTESILSKIQDAKEAQDIFARMLKMDIPFHSHTMIEHIDQAPSGYAEITVSEGTIPFYSTVTGKKAGAGDFDGAYWAKHISEPVRFAEAIDALIADGHNVFMEVGPHGAHPKDLADAMAHNKVEEYIISGSLRRNSDDALELDASLAFAHTRGYPLETENWPAASKDAFEKVLQAFTDLITEDQSEDKADPDELRGLENAARLDAIVDLIQRLVRKVGKVPEDKLADLDAGFMSMGINSIMSVQLKELLAKELGLSLANTLIFDYPNITRLADYLASQLGGSDGSDMFANRAWETVDAFADQLAELSDSDAEKLLEEEIERVGRTEGLTGNKKLLYLLKKEQVRQDPVAIVGMACRLPGGANDIDKYWSLLADGRDGTSEIPADRWNNSEFFDRDKTIPGKSYVNRGGFLRDYDPYAFDPFFFKISPKEALGLDPQQRLLLEVAAEAFQNANMPLEQLNGMNIGSYVGICSDDYKGAHLYSGDLTKIDAYSLLGTALSAAGGRISFTWGLQGPAVSIDTACSSSLIATHMACKGIRNGECDAAVVAGVNYLLNPVYFVYFSKLQAVSPDGQCKTFDASANGYSRGEGCGVIILKRLSMAIEDNDNILGIIKGSAINQDGASSGFTAPNGIAQQDLLKRAMRDADITEDQISYVETHGTGTPLGDPIEANAIAAVYGQGHSKEDPLIMGSVKSSIGHLEGAAGVSGILKILLALQKNAIPANLHFKNPNPDIDWDNISIKVPTELTPWETNGQKRIAGVSGFGFSGSNAHIVIEEGPKVVPAQNEKERSSQLLTVSARDAGALKDYAKLYADFLNNNQDVSLGDICYSASTGRSHYTNRVSVVADSHEGMAEALQAVAEDANDKRVKSNVIPGPRKSKIAFLFTGQGSQYFAMGRELYETNSLFRKHMDECEAILSEHLGLSLLDILYNEEGDQKRINQTAYTQPGIFAVEYALAKLWMSFGIQPDYVMGHSVGEYVAAVISGLMSLEDGAKLIAERGRLMNALPEGGVMAAIFAPRERIEELLKPWEGKLNVAAHNSPGVNTISGEAEALDEAMEVFAENKVKARKLVVSHAFHSHLMDPMLEEFAAFASKLQFNEPKIPLISNVTCQPIKLEEVTPEYWCQHVRGTVGFHDSMQTLKALGANTFVEVGADVTLSGLGKQCLPGYEAIWVSSLKRKNTNWDQLLNAVGELYTNGVAIDWKGFEGHYDRRKVVLPNYPYQRKRYYLNPYNFPAEGFAGGGMSFAAGDDAHLLLGSEFPSPMAERLFLQSWDLENQAFVADHIIYEMPLVPGTAYVEMGMAAAKALYGTDKVAVGDVNLKEAFVLSPDETVSVQSVIREEGDQQRLFVHSRKGNDDAEWKSHGDMALYNRDALGNNDGGGFDPVGRREALDLHWTGEQFYDTCEAIGYRYGNRHRALTNLWFTDREAVTELDVAAAPEGYLLDPGTLDCIIQVFIATHVGSKAPEEVDSVIVPVHIDQVLVDAPLEGKLWVHFQIHDWSEETRRGDMIVQNSEGEILARILGITAQKVSQEALKKAAAVGIDHMLWNQEWVSQRFEGSDARKDRVIVLLEKEDDPVAQALGSELSKEHTVVRLHSGDGFQAKDGGFSVKPTDKVSFDQALQAIVDAHGRIDTVVQGWGLGHADLNNDQDILNSQRDMLGGSLHLVQAMSAASINPEFFLLSQDAEKIDGSESGIRVAQAPLSGLGNVMELELPSMRCVRVDLSRGSETEISMLIDEIEQAGTENRLAYREADRYVQRFVNIKNWTPAAGLDYPDAENYFLDSSSKGLLDNLYLQPTEIPQAADNEVVIRVHATGLNFRDVLNALGQYPGDAGLFGLECSGVVTAVGSKVSKFQIGDRVMANANGSFRKYINYAEEYVVKIPEGVSFEDAVTIPGPFLTAWYGLVRKGKIKSGDKVLIHAGAGGVGMAAVQIALSMGAEVFATASEPKQQFLRDLGVHHVHNSRNLDFAEEIKTITDGKGVDLILNSLAGEFIEKSFSILGDHGRFVEMGKMNIWTTEQAKAANETFEYHAFDLAADGAEDPSLIESMFAELDEQFSAGKLEPLPKTVFSFQNTIDAFRYMSQARHIGKIVISQAEDIRKERIAQDGLAKADATYVITGGLGALGLMFAEWLGENGAKHVALFGRSKPKPHAEEAINKMRENGMNVRVFSADVSSRESLEDVFGQIDENMPEIKGIIHAAGILDDGMMISTDWDRFEGALKPKVNGAWMLHELSMNRDLDMFILFSSVAAVFGNRGQSNYASGNAFLDGLAHYRRSLGLAATSVNWGPWGAAGMATDAKKAAIIAKQGFYNIRTEDGLEAMYRALAEEMPQLCVVELNIKNFVSNLSDELQAGFFEQLASKLGGGAAGGDAAGGASKRDFWTEMKIAEGDDEQGLALITEEVKLAVAAVLNFKSTEDIDGDRQFRELGFDSLTNAEFINKLDKTMGLGLSQSLYMEFPTVNQMSTHLLTMPALLDKLSTIEVSEADKAAASQDTAGSEDAPKAAQPKAAASTPKAGPKAGPVASSSNGKSNGQSNGKSKVSEDLSYHSPVKGHGGSNTGKSIEDQTDDIMAQHLSGKKADTGEKKSLWQRFIDAMTDIEN